MEDATFYAGGNTLSRVTVERGGGERVFHNVLGLKEGVDRGRGYRDKGAESGVEGAESGVEGAGSGGRGGGERGAGIEGAGSGDRGGWKSGQIGAGN